MGLFSACTGKTDFSQSTEAPARSLRIAHITDVHIGPERDKMEKFAQCLRQIHELEDKPDFIFAGGDCIGDALDKNRGEVEAQWASWHEVIQKECAIPLVNCIGNHDVWGAGDPSDPLYGKAWAKKELKLNERYYSFDSHGWHFIVLDSTHIRPDGTWYTAKLDEEQFAWLQSDLKNLPENAKVLVLSHIPILAASAFLDGDNAQSGDWVVPGAWMHIDAGKIIELFYAYPQVKVCLSGHLHLLDKVVYNNVTYYCNGATSGSWWDETPYHQTYAGYAIVDLYADGSSKRHYVEYLKS